MTATDVVYYNAVGEDGGAIDLASPITSGQLNNLFPDVDAQLAESGGDVFRKFFIKNTHGSDTALATNVAMTRFSDAGDFMSFFLGTNTDTTADYVTTPLYGIGKASAELDRPTKTVEIDVEPSQTLADIFREGESIVFIDSSTGQKIVKATIATGGVGATNLVIDEDIPAEIVLNGSYISSIINNGDLVAGEAIAVWVKQTVPAFTTAYANSYFGVNTIFVSS